MKRLYFYVEGPTEQGYVKRVLKPHLATFGVMVMGAILTLVGNLLADLCYAFADPRIRNR